MYGRPNAAAWRGTGSERYPRNDPFDVGAVASSCCCCAAVPSWTRPRRDVPMFSEEPFFLAEIDGSWIAFPNSPMPATGSPMTANGGTDPYPIPWLDKNGSHNQPAGPKLEPSHIYHFKGRVARSSTFAGMGTDNEGNRIAF